MGRFTLHLVPDGDCDREGLTDLLLHLIKSEEIKDRESTEDIGCGLTIAELLDNEELQREAQAKGIHIGYSFPITISKIDLKDFVEGKRESLKTVILIEK